MNGLGASAGFGVLSAASWGGADFAGGIGSRRAPALLVTAFGQAISLLLLIPVCLALGISMPAGHSLVFAVIGGFEGALALAIFYRALALGAMGLTAALTGLLTALVPVVFSLTRYGLPSPFTAAGLAAGCAAIWLITHPSGRTGTPTPVHSLLLGALAGAGFGAQLIFFKMAEGASLLGIMTAARAAGVTALLLVMLWARPRGSGRSYWLPATVSGLLDTAGNLLYMRAVQFGRLDAAAVICSLYPAGTILLAALLLRERPSRRQWAGMALALGAVALLSF